MRTLKWDPVFNPEEDTTTTIACISFPSLPPNHLGEEVVFSLALAVGKPLQVDLSTKNKTRPNCAGVKALLVFKEVQTRTRDPSLRMAQWIMSRLKGTVMLERKI
ncbi:hypothetical protein EJD97_016444 [Solanum chilense]|uniref:Uncharacterized protein n=1 Tax=Solanum chilense TaxID=4083 RepID=A0A6N2B4Y3_SOLCI|nr:hypothetical protein EJD97_016444 [Solanum chilense]